MDERKTEKWVVMVTPSEFERLETWCFANRYRSRSDAIRFLVGLQLDALEGVEPAAIDPEPEAPAPADPRPTGMLPGEHLPRLTSPPKPRDGWTPWVRQVVQKMIDETERTVFDHDEIVAAMGPTALQPGAEKCIPLNMLDLGFRNEMSRVGRSKPVRVYTYDKALAYVFEPDPNILALR